MKYALTIFPTDEAIRPDELARAAEDRGFESLFFPEHTHIPCSRKTPYPAGGELPREYTRTHDPFVALTMAAAVTKKIKLATGICLVIERDPITTAKEVASLDYLSGGRAMLGIGAGWNVEEMGNHGTDFKSRWQLLRERVEAMKAIWQHERAEYHGKLVGFDPIGRFPSPCRSRIRRCCSADTGGRRSSAWCATATAGCRSLCALAISRRKLPSFARRQEGGPIRVDLDLGFLGAGRPREDRRERRDGSRARDPRLPPAP